MPTESPHVNSGPPTAGQSPQPGHPPPHTHTQYSINQGGIPQHQRTQQVHQHGHNHNHNRHSMPAMPYGIQPPPPRAMPPQVTNQPASGPPMQQPSRVAPAAQYYNGYMPTDYAPPPIPGPNPFQFMQPAYPFYPISAPPPGPPAAPHAPPQPQPPMNGRAQRPFSQPPPNHQHAMPRPTQTQQSIIPQRRRKILAIVDPDSNEEIKPEKAVVSAAPTTAVKPAPAVKIGPPVSRPLTLVSDPADAKSSNKAAEKVPEKVPEKAAEKKPEPPAEKASEKTSEKTTEKPAGGEDTKPSQSDGSTVKGGDDVAELTAAVNDLKVTDDQSKQSADSTAKSAKATVNEPSQDSSVSPELVVAASDDKDSKASDQKAKETTTVDSKAPEESSKTAPVPEKEGNLDGMVSDVSSSTFADVHSDSTDGPPSKPEENSSKSLAESTPVTDAPKTPKAVVESVAVDDLKKEDGPAEASKVDAKEPAKKETAEETKTAEDTEESGEAKDEKPMPSITFKPGERHVFPRDFMLAMADFANTKRESEFMPLMTQCDIVKGVDNENKTSIPRRSNSRDSHPSRMGSGSGSDPRGRTFPSMQFQMPIRGALPPGGGEMASFDLHRARSQPPPALKSVPSGRDGDPRGSRSHGRGGRHGGPMRSSNTPVEPVIPQPPVEKLKRSENAWKPDKEADDETTTKVKAVRSLLNKLTLEKFDRIFQQIVEIEINNAETLTGIVKEIFEKPLFEPKFSSMYAELCRRLDEALQPGLNEKKLNFRRVLLNNCKDEFTRFSSGTKGSESATEGESTDQDKVDSKESKKPKAEKKELTPLEKEEEEMKALKAKQRMLANVRFIGELYLKDLLREQIIHRSCIVKLLHLASESPEEDVLEAVCKLISKTGAKLSGNSTATEHINQYFKFLVNFSVDKRVPARIRFMIQDLIEQRANNWKVRREEVGAKTIAEIHKDIEEKERQKQEAANAMRERKHRNQGSRMDHGRGMGQPRLSMTMASASKAPSSGLSRTNMLLERGLNRSSTNMSMSSQSSMRLGPKSSFVGSSGPSLRPRTSLKTTSSNISPATSNSSMSGSRFSALNSDPERPASGIGSSDSNRSKLTATKPISHRRQISKPEPATPPVELMEPAVVKRKAKSLYEEYLSIESIDEFTACLAEEVQKPNYPAFIENVVKIVLEGKKDSVPKTQKLFTALLDNNTVPAKLFVDAFEKYGPELMNLEMDYPLATELYAEIATAAASTKAFKAVEGNGEFGVGFVRKIFDKMSEKNAAAKLIVLLCGAFYQREKNSNDDAGAKRFTRKVFSSFNIDLSAEMTAWDDFMGPKMLNRMLDRANLMFLLPAFEIEEEVKSVLERDPKEDAIFAALNSSKVDVSEEENQVEVVKIIIRIALDSVFSEEGKLQERLEPTVKTVGSALVRKFKFGSALPRNHQLAALCAVQSYFARAGSKLPTTVGDQQTASAVFSAIYSSNVVEEEGFRQWKDDTGVTMAINGKEKLLVDTSRFFKWLDEAEEE